ncbi:MAG TPA: MgtC/SapB family protein [Holophaga sp.]|nr:MgtC/SapB family protein [Holophaga sp.]HPS66273.1 MgtC/SapB family protein [Holophaga sp.]
MQERLLAFVPVEAYHLVLVLFLSFLIGLEREEQKRGGKRMFGGVRTFPLLGLMGYVLALISKESLFGVLVGLVAVSAFMVMSYWHKLQTSPDTAGITTEISGLVVYLVGVLVYMGLIWFACALVVVSLLLLELKVVLEGLTDRLEPEEITAFTKFLLLTLVVLPMVPNRDFGPFRVNPFKTWLVVVAVSGISYASYLLLKLVKGRGGIFLSGILGGIYSSTVTTVVLAKRAAGGHHPHDYSGSILTASGLMYLRVLGLVWMFNAPLAATLGPSFATLAVVAIAVGWVWHHLPDEQEEAPPAPTQAHNPLELRTAFLFAALFVVMLVATHLAVVYLGRSGIYSLAALMGVTDVDPFIMGMTQSAGLATSLEVAASGIVVATACNNLVKGIYACFFARGKAGFWSLALLAGLSVLGLLPVLWI